MSTPSSWFNQGRLAIYSPRRYATGRALLAKAIEAEVTPRPLGVSSV